MNSIPQENKHSSKSLEEFEKRMTAIDMCMIKLRGWVQRIKGKLSEEELGEFHSLNNLITVLSDGDYNPNKRNLHFLVEHLNKEFSNLAKPFEK